MIGKKSLATALLCVSGLAVLGCEDHQHNDADWMRHEGSGTNHHSIQNRSGTDGSSINGGSSSGMNSNSASSGASNSGTSSGSLTGR